MTEYANICAPAGAEWETIAARGKIFCVKRGIMEEKKEGMCVRRIFRRTDLLVVAGLLLIAAVGWGVRCALTRQTEAQAVISYRGQEQMRVDLADAPAQTVTLPQAPQVVITFDGAGGVAVTHSDCPDQICVAAGRLSKPGDFAACVPNGVTVRITGSDGVDAVARP